MLPLHKKLKMVKKLYEHVRIHPAISQFKNIVLQTFEFCSDCRCDRHFADIKTQFSIPHKTSKIGNDKTSNDKKDFLFFAISDFDVCLISA